MEQAPDRSHRVTRDPYRRAPRRRLGRCRAHRPRPQRVLRTGTDTETGTVKGKGLVRVLEALVTMTVAAAVMMTAVEV